MQKKYWFFLIALVSVVFILEYDMTKRASVSNIKVNSSSTKKAVILENDSENEIKRKVASENFQEELKEKLNQVTSEISSLQIDPEAVETNLQKLATQLSEGEINILLEVIVDKNTNGDRRAMAVELLSRNKSVEALRKLEDFVKSHSAVSEKPSEETDWSREQEFESVLRAQAVEGIATFPPPLANSVLTDLRSKVNESFLKDRIERSLAGLNKGMLPVDKQDEQALRKLIE